MPEGLDDMEPVPPKGIATVLSLVIHQGLKVDDKMWVLTGFLETPHPSNTEQEF